MIKVGITGGIGSGKTTVADVWQSFGAYVLNADDLAKRIMVENEEIKKQIIETFGDKSYHSDGSLNRRYLAEQAFSQNRVKELNAIVHPRIPEKSREIIDQAEKEGYDIFVYEAALLFENLTPGLLDYIVLVLADQEKRLDRVAARDKIKKKAIQERIDKQQNFENLKHPVDFIIENNNSLDSLKREATELFHVFLTKK